MKAVTKFLLPIAALGSAFFISCSGESAESADSTTAASKVTIPDAPDAAVEVIAKELADGNGGILWQAMPASYQADMNIVAQLAGSKVDAEVYNKSFALVGRLAEVADKQKEFILNTELGGKQPEEDVAKLEAAWPSIIGFVETIAQSSISSSEGLQSFDGQNFFDTTVSKLIEYSEGLSAINEEELPITAYKDVDVKVLSQEGAIAMLEMTAPDGVVESEEFTQVEGRWVPSELAADWTTKMAEAKAKLEAISPEEIAQKKPQVMGVITMLEGVLTQIESAQTQEQFDQAVQGAMMPLMGLMMMQQ